MKTEILQCIATALNHLDLVYVRGGKNLSNLSNAIILIENLGAALNELDIIVPEKQDNPEKKGR